MNHLTLLDKLSLLPWFIQNRIFIYRIAQEPTLKNITFLLSNKHLYLEIRELNLTEFYKCIKWHKLFENSNTILVKKILNYPKFINWQPILFSNLQNLDKQQISKLKNMEINYISKLYLSHIESLLNYIQ